MQETNLEKKESMEERQVVVFNLAKEEFGVNINEVREIVRMEQITKIPNTEQYIKGVINLRGGIIVIIDLATKLGLAAKEADKNTRIIVIEMEKNTVGMIVDSATEVLRINEDKIQPPPKIIEQKINADYIEGVGILGERLLILLDLVKVLQAKDIEQIQNVQSQMRSNDNKQDQEENKQEKKEENSKAEKPLQESKNTQQNK